jgi:hypothetical protein
MVGVESREQSSFRVLKESRPAAGTSEVDTPAEKQTLAPELLISVLAPLTTSLPVEINLNGASGT